MLFPLRVFLHDQQQRVVHERVLAQKFDVLLNPQQKFQSVRSPKKEKLFILADVQEVDVFERAFGFGAFGLDLDLTVDHGALQVEAVLRSFALDLGRVRHQQNVDGSKLLQLHSVKTVDASQERVFVVPAVVEVLGQGPLEHTHLVVVHRLDQETFVVAEKEERATLPSRFFGIKNLFTILFGIQRVEHRFCIDSVHLPYCFEDGWSVLFCHHLFVDLDVTFFVREVFVRRVIV